MARRAPSAQLALFDDLPKSATPTPEAIVALVEDGEAASGPVSPVELFSPEMIVTLDTIPQPPPVPDRLAIVIPVSSKSGGSILAAARHIEVSDDVLFSLRISLFDLGPLDRFDAEDIEAVIAACGKVEMRRFDLPFPALAPRFDGGPALYPDETDDLAALLDHLRSALRSRGAPAGDGDDNGPHLPLGAGASPGGHASLDRPLKLPVREFALVRVFGDGGYEVQKKWALAA